MAIIDSANLSTDADGGIPSGDDSGTVPPASGPLDPNAEPKRKRGRPSNADKAARSSGGSADTSGTATRGSTQAGSYEKAQGKATGKKSLDISGYGLQIQGFHALAAIALKNPLIEISKTEADSLASALADVMKQYSINVSPAVMAWVKLATVSAAVYGPKVVATIAIKKAQAPQRQVQQAPASNAPVAQQQQGPVIGVPPVGAQPSKMSFG